MGISHLTWLKFKFWFPSQHLNPYFFKFSLFIHFLSQKPRSHFRFFFFCHPLYPVHQLAHPVGTASNIYSESDHLLALHYYHLGPSYHYPLAGSTILSSMFSWLSLIPSTQQQNHRFLSFHQIASLRCSKPCRGCQPSLEQNLKPLPWPTKTYMM